MVLTLVSKEIITYIPGTGGGDIDTVDGTDSYGQNHRIGELKRLELVYDSDVDIAGFSFFINTALFMPVAVANPISGKGQTYFSYVMPAVVVPDNDYVCILQTVVGANLPLIKNYKVTITPDTTYSVEGEIFRFKITVACIMHADCKGYLGTPQTNRVKLLKDAFDNPAEILADISNISSFAVVDNQYSEENYSPRVYTYAENLSLDPTESFSIEEKFEGFEAGFYEKGAANAAPHFTDTYFKVLRSAVEQSNLVTYEPNNIEVWVTSPNTTTSPLTHLMVWIIRTNTTNDTVDIFNNYDSNISRVQGTSPTVGKLTAPMTSPAIVSGNTYKATFDVTGLTAGEKYRLVGVAYSFDGVHDFQCTSFISPEYETISTKNFDGGGFTATAFLSDYNTEFTENNLECVVEERMKLRVNIAYPSDQWKDDIYDRFGLVVANDLRKYLTQVKIEFYEEYFDAYIGGTIKNVFDTQVIPRTAPLTYNEPLNTELVFGTDETDIIYKWRNRFEDYIPNLMSYLNGNPIGPYTTQDWAGKTIKIKTTLSFYYDDIDIPFTDNVNIYQQIRVNDYGGMTVQHINEANTEFDEVVNVCLDENGCFAGVLDTNLSDRKLIVNVIETGVSINNMEEAEVWVGTQLPQLTTGKIASEDEDYTTIFTEKAAKFCIDSTKFIVGKQYSLSALAKRVQAFCDFISATGGTIVEDGNYNYHIFAANGDSFEVSCISEGAEVEYLIVGGGGGGGGFAGGGAGGVKAGTISILPGSYPIVVGGGGSGAVSQELNGTSGSNSSFHGLIAYGGGGGGGYGAIEYNGLNGGSGGGGGYQPATGIGTGGTGTAGQGYAGGNGSAAEDAGGGGGGASSVGGNGTTETGGAGGNGVSNSITGVAVTYGGGGGGAGLTFSGTGGTGGGGNGAIYLGSSATSGTNGLGGGGGGAYADDTAGDGGSGIVIIRYLAR